LTTLIIGAGLVGSQVARILVEQGEKPVLMDRAAQPEAIGQIVELSRVTLIEGDILRPLTLTKAFRDHGITAIVHTAANPMLTLGAQRDPYAAIELNIMGTVNVLEAARTHGIKRVVVSSSNVLSHFLAGGEGKGDLMREEAFPRPTTFYSATKQAVESLGLNYARWCGIEFAGMRYGAVFGPWSGHGGGGPSNIVREAIGRALRGEEATVPAAAMEWVYSKDAGNGTVMALKAKSLANGIFNVSMGVLASPEDLADAIRTAIPGAKVRIETAAATAVSVPDMRGLSDPTNSKAVLGYTPRYGLVDAIRDLADWMRPRNRV
jgi:nucleoside-diphosphate-sugar epimerase